MYSANFKRTSRRRPSVFDLPTFPAPKPGLLQPPCSVQPEHNTKVKIKSGSKLQRGIPSQFSSTTSVKPKKKKINHPSLQPSQRLLLSDSSRLRESQLPSTIHKARTSVPLSPSPRHPRFPRIQRRSTVFSVHASNIPLSATAAVQDLSTLMSDTGHPQTYDRPLPPSKINALRSTYVTLTSHAKRTSTGSISSLTSVAPSQIRLSHVLNFLNQELQATSTTVTSSVYSDSESEHIAALTRADTNGPTRFKHDYEDENESDFAPQNSVQVKANANRNMSQKINSKVDSNVNHDHPCLISNTCKLTPHLVRYPRIQIPNTDIPVLVRWVHEGRYCYTPNHNQTRTHTHNQTRDPTRFNAQLFDAGIRQGEVPALTPGPEPAQDILTLYSTHNPMPPSIRRLLLTGTAEFNRGVNGVIRDRNRRTSQDGDVVQNKPFGKEGVDWEIDGEGVVWVRDERGITATCGEGAAGKLRSAWWVRWDGC